MKPGASWDIPGQEWSEQQCIDKAVLQLCKKGENGQFLREQSLHETLYLMTVICQTSAWNEKWALRICKTIREKYLASLNVQTT